MTVQLSDTTHAEITALCKQGDDLVRAGNLEAGKNKYVEAPRRRDDK
ncbi:hypothetical protein [Aneurinibacillus aneurinilyticus]|jgi:hypothetical protein|nr:hypothetical protein [Aneurinibacillus aneurinilyticus]MCI1696842.1 hypothetical protein [Aneurinibacillus aneurinilyticus]